MTTQNEQPQVFRLEDIQVHEVSVVDRAANKRKFLIVKNEGVMSKKSGAGAEVKPNGKGGHTVAKDDVTTAPPSGEPPPAPPANTAADSTPTPAPQVEKLRISPEARAEMLKRTTGALERLTTLKTMLEGAEEAAGITEVPNEIVLAVGDVLHLLAEGDGTTTEATKAELAKDRKQISTIREAKLRAAHGAIGDILAELEALPAPTTDAMPEPAPASTTSIEDTISKKFLALEERLAKGLTGVLDIVQKQATATNKQAERIESITKDSGRAPSNGARTEESNVEKSTKRDGVWPMDMNAPGFAQHGPGDRFDSNRGSRGQ